MTKGKALGLAAIALAAYLIPFPVPKRRKDEDMIDDQDDDETPTIDESTSGFRARILRIAAGEIGKGKDLKYAAEAVGVTEAQAAAQGMDRLSWCGLFVTWVLRQAGADVRWVLGKGLGLPRTTNPQPGDIAYFIDTDDDPEAEHHYAIVEHVGAELLTSIDGNSTGGLVARRPRALAEVTAFYSVATLDPEATIAGI